MEGSRRYRLFVYGTFLKGEPDHGLLEGADLLGTARSVPRYKLVESGPLAGLIEPGDTAVVGEIYEVDQPTLARCDLKREHPRLFQRKRVMLDDGGEAEAYLLSVEQARGLRRVRGGDWRNRFRKPRPEPGAFVQWARGRHGRR